MTVISREQIDAQGYRNAFDALSALTENTGNVQGEDFGNTFTPAANTINLRGLGPNRTLVLVNGRRQADYPLAYEGSVNVVNLANIPSALIERIEVLAPVRRRCTAPMPSPVWSTSSSRTALRAWT